jgi:replicative DNA helicase
MSQDLKTLFDAEASDFKPVVDRAGFTTMQVDPEEHIKSLAARRDALSPFGISFLDECLGGISNEDLIVIGADTGIGKTQLSLSLGIHSAVNGRKVDYFALEAYEKELQDRVTYRAFAKMFFQAYREGKVKYDDIDPQDYLNGAYVGKYDEIIRAAAQSVSQIQNFHAYYPKSILSLEAFIKKFMAIKNDTDLIIVDHLHYFDYDEEQENRAIKRIVMELKLLSNVHKKPIILVSHVRKMDKRNPQDVPMIVDLHGSSEIAKNATKVVTFGRYYSDDYGDDYTCVAAFKNRFGGNRVYSAALIKYDPQQQTYGKQYILGKTYQHDAKFREWGDKMGRFPHWARSADNKPESFESNGLIRSVPGPNAGKTLAQIKAEGPKRFMPDDLKT